MPLWTVLLARFVLGERLTPAAGLRIGLALAGASDRALARRVSVRRPVGDRDEFAAAALAR